MDPPTVFLPPLKTVGSCSNHQLLHVLRLLHQIFIPEVRGSRIRQKGKVPPADNDETEAELERIRTDSFERSFSVQWLTRFISIYTQDANQNNSIIERAAAVLALCAGETASGPLTRTFTFRTNNIGLIGTTSFTSHDNLSVTIRDAPFESFDTASVGAKTWGGSCILSQLITETPEAFGILPRSLSSSPSFRALDLGAGTGLASIVFGKLLQQLKNYPDSHLSNLSVVATDFHPSVLSNLCFNLSENFSEQRRTINSGSEANLPLPSHHPAVRACPLDWAEVHDAKSNPSKKQDHWIYDLDFDVVLGADIIYEDTHAVWIKSCIEYFLKKPSCGMRYNDFSTVDLLLKSVPLFHLIIPLRSTHVKESRLVEATFPLAEEIIADRRVSGDHLNNTQWDLAILSQEDITCDTYTDEEKGDVVYRYYRIGWM